MRRRFPYKPLSAQRGMPWPHPPGARPAVRVHSATAASLIMIEVKAVGNGIVLDSNDMEIPGDRYVHVELTPHIARAIADGDLEKRPQPLKARRKPTAKAAAPSKAGATPAKQAAKKPAPMRSLPKSKPAKKAEGPPTLRRQMIARILRAEFGDNFSDDDIIGKKTVVHNGWDKECEAPLGDTSRHVKWEEPDRKTVKLAIRDYLARPKAYEEELLKAKEAQRRRKALTEKPLQKKGEPT